MNQTDNSLIAVSTSNSLGNIYDPISGLEQFGDPVPEDFVFTYTDETGRVKTGEVNYINEDDGISNTLVLQVDPSDGKARIINDSNFDNINFDGYTIWSDSGSLLTGWDSLEDQEGEGDITGWEKAGTPGTTVLSELNPFDALEIDAHQVGAVMTGLFNTGGTQDLFFDIHVSDYDTGGGGVLGDYNEDGIVNAADYTVWRNAVEAGATSLPNEDPSTSPGAVDQADYLFWRSNYGSTTPGPGGELISLTLDGVVRYESFSLGSGAGSQVPEPSSIALLSFAGLIGGLAVGRKKRC